MKETTVERITEFNEENFRTNEKVTLFSENLVSDDEWKEFDENALTISDGNTLYQYAEEYPIVAYRRSDDFMMMPFNRLNTFIRSITVSTAMSGKRFSIKKGTIEEEIVGPDTVAYFCDNIGRCYAIPQYDIFRILMKKPHLVISQEGLLIFFTQKEILATIDCEHYAWVGDIDTDNGVIKNIDVYDSYCIVNVEYTVEGAKKVLEKNYKVQFTIDMVDHGMISSKTTSDT